jgi:hypothetical protein
MNDKSNTPDGDENLGIENDFLKMKLMLEQGAQFGSVEERNEDFSPELENQFLRNIIDFEKQFAEHKLIKVFDKIGRPVKFKPVDEIPEADIDNAWDELDEYLNKNSIDLAVCSPNISKKELYRFTVEELFDYEIDDMDLLGMVTCFTYDQFYPDHVYENTRMAIEECLNYILRKQPMEWAEDFRKEDLQLNQHSSLSVEELKIIVNMFKQAYDELEIKEITENECVVAEKESWVSGTYEVLASFGGDSCTLSGNWKVIFEKDHLGYWNIVNVQLEGVRF